MRSATNFGPENKGMVEGRPMTCDDGDKIRVEIPGTNLAIGISIQLFDHFPANDIWKEVVDFSRDPDGYVPGIWIDVERMK